MASNASNTALLGRTSITPVLNRARAALLYVRNHDVFSTLVRRSEHCTSGLSCSDCMTGAAAATS
eukprot:3527609-Prymnesium_polylepis.2